MTIVIHSQDGEIHQVQYRSSQSNLTLHNSFFSPKFQVEGAFLFPRPSNPPSPVPHVPYTSIFDVPLFPHVNKRSFPWLINGF